MSATQTEIVQRIPIHWAVTLVVLFALPFGFFLDKFNFNLWVCFIVWAEYFALGAVPKNWRLIIPSIPFGAAIGAAWCATAVALISALGLSMFWALELGAIFWLTLYVYINMRVPTFIEGTLPSFNGFTLYLAVYFTGSLPKAGSMDNPYWVVFWAFIWTILMAYFGWFLGWFNIFLTFPKEVVKAR
jgi:hypothetical protein